ncbi:MAG: DUF58 domain-containing protein [Streptosporangiaceae bacterium]
MRSLFAGLTTRGTSFLAAGVAALGTGLVLGERILISVGILLIGLPLLAALSASQARYRLSCARAVSPQRVPPGHTARVTLNLENVSRFPSGLMLAEDSVPYTLGARPRYVLDGIEHGGARTLSYPLRSDLRGRFEIGPLDVRIADAFGLVELGRSFSATSTFLVTPEIVPLDRSVVSGSWLGDGDGGTRTSAAAGEDDVIPRAYRNGDELRRVHWRSTARYGELMVRREEQRWRNQAVLLLDTRRSAHAGAGAASSFEYAVSAAASIGMHLAREGLDGQLVTDTGAVTSPARFEDLLLDSLAVIQPSGCRGLDTGTAALQLAEGGLLIVVAGRLSAAQARRLAACRRDFGPAIAVLLAVSSWLQPAGPAAGPALGSTQPAGPAAAPSPGQYAETAEAAAILRAAGWRVTSADAATPLAAAWQRVPRFPGMPAAGSSPLRRTEAVR